MLSERIAGAVFWLICGALSVYLVGQQFLKYFENADTPKISFRPFNKSPKGTDVYPDLTFCWVGVSEGQEAELHKIYKKNYLMEKHNFNDTKYQSLLMGESKAWGATNSQQVADVDFNKASMGLISLLRQHTVVSERNISIQYGRQLKMMHRTFQIPGMICFTRTLETYLKEGDLLMMEHFRINLAEFRLYVFVHYPGQMLRYLIGTDRIHKAAMIMTLSLIHI